MPTYPDAGRFWKMIQDHRVTVFYTAPTASGVGSVDDVVHATFSALV